VLHRDLKPSNIMIDSRGQVRITDFGLAAVAEEIGFGDIRSGTPAYMSPEQKAGKEVTVRSDLYALGLVIHEMFTGKRRGGTETTPSEIVKGLDPLVERVILRCLEEDPKRRPSSALNVAMALPGADPIAAALAVGETPSPEIVGASQGKEGFSLKTATMCFVAVVLLLGAYVWTYPLSPLLQRARVDTPPDGLAFRAQDVLRQLGYAEASRRTAYGFDWGAANFVLVAEQYGPARRDALLATHQPAVIRFWYRQHQQEFWADSFLLPDGANGVITYNSPAHVEPGMIRLALDMKGRLTALEARPVAGAPPHSEAPDWQQLFSLAGFDPARFARADPRHVPPMAVDSRLAWTGAFDADRSERVRLEAAAWNGRVVYVNVTGDWETEPNPSPLAGAQLARVLALVLALGGAVAVAKRNLGLGRGDRKGAARIAAAVFILLMGGWALSAAHVRSYWEIHLIVAALSWATFVAAVIWVSYLAVEPYMRRYWPDTLISWTRLYSGRVQDPLVASHMLAGILAFAAVNALTGAFLYIAGGQRVGSLVNIPALSSGRMFVATVLTSIALNSFVIVALFVLVVVARLLVRRVWIADLLVSILVGAGIGGIPVNDPRLYAALALVYFTGSYILLWLLRRYGLVAAIAFIAVFGVLSMTPIDFSAWYAGRPVAVLLTTVGIAAWAVWAIHAGRRSVVPVE
jgi:serine/threonine-protein kinase